METFIVVIMWIVVSIQIYQLIKEIKRGIRLNKEIKELEKRYKQKLEEYK